MFADVVFPMPFRMAFTYRIPDELSGEVKIGVRVVVSFGRRILTGFVIKVKENAGSDSKIKDIQDVLDKNPIFDEESLKFYKWLSDYYLSSLGEALKNSVPYGTDVETKRKIVADSERCYELFLNEKKKSTIRAQILKYFSDHDSCRLNYLQKQIGRKNIYSVLRTLENKGALAVINEIEEAKVRVKKAKFVRLSAKPEEIFEFLDELEKRSPKQAVILLYLISNKINEIPLSELIKETKSSQSSVKSLVEKSYVEIFDKEVKRNYIEHFEEKKENFILTERQSEIIKSVKGTFEKDKYECFLLHGVTGSGKTQVYIELAKEIIQKGKSVLILVPEIALTPQMTARLINNFGEKVAVLHSQMSLGERFDSWRQIVAGEKKIVVGARSALFAPLKEIGLIVVDEEHDQSYKQADLIPRYNARDAAVVKAWMEKCPVMLGSATPSVESMYNAKSGKYTLLELPERIDNAMMPEIKLVNVKIERKKKNMENIFSKTLIDEIKKRVEKKESVIILQNRRGFATQVYCEDCNEVETCPDCSVGMVLHLNRNILQCHYCGFTKKVEPACTNCGSFSTKYFGTGTQRVEDELEYYLPDIKIERIDSDTINKKNKLGIVLNNFRKGEIDVLVGTQMVSKGLDFANVTLVGVISAETSLWMPDFRADERTFQLLTQVSGRAGRSKTKGEVVIQTQDDNHFILQKVLDHDYQSFFKREISLRKNNGYPPFSRICLIEAKDKDLMKAKGAIFEFYNLLIKRKRSLSVSQPTEAMIHKLKGYYRYHIMIKSSREIDKSGSIMRKAVFESFKEFNTNSKFRDIRLFFDIDPQNII